jgi:hypothetical protein
VRDRKPSDTVRVICDRCHEFLFSAAHSETEQAEDGKPVHAYVYAQEDYQRGLAHVCKEGQ